MAIKPIEAPRAPEAPRIAKQDRRAVVVAGVNVPDSNSGNQLPRGQPPRKDRSTWHRTFLHMAHRYMREWAFGPGGLDKVIIFDFLEGTTLEYRKGGSSEKDGEPVGLKHEPLVDANYRFADGSEQSYVLRAKAPKDATLHYWTGLHHYAASRSIDLSQTDIPIADYWAQIDRWVGEENSLSMDSVYFYITNCPDRSVRELHFFSHGFFDGPVLVNTLRAWQGGDAPWLPVAPRNLGSGREKSLFDKDCRSADRPPGESNFRSSFATDAIVGIWGCDADAGRSRGDLVRALELRGQGKPVPAELKERLRERLVDTYAQAFALKTQLVARGPTFGTFSVEDAFEEPGIDRKLLNPKLMHIQFEQCAHILRLFQEELGVFFPVDGLYAGHPKYGRGFASYPMFMPF
jgi:hypothetical protein